MEALYRVLFTPGAEITMNLPLVNEVEGFDSLPQEYCGMSEENGQSGEVWEFVTDRPAAMEAMLDADPSVIAYVRKG